MTNDLRVKSDLTLASDADARAALAEAADALARGEAFALRVIAEENGELQELLGRDWHGVDAALTEAVRLALAHPGRNLDAHARFRFVAAVLAEFRPGVRSGGVRTVEFEVWRPDRPDWTCRMSVPKEEAERVVRQTLGLESVKALVETRLPPGLTLDDFDPQTVLLRFWPDAIYRYVRARRKRDATAAGEDDRFFRASAWQVGLA